MKEFKHQLIRCFLQPRKKLYHQLPTSPHHHRLHSNHTKLDNPIEPSEAHSNNNNNNHNNINNINHNNLSKSHSSSRNYVTNSKTTMANIVKAPLHPLNPPPPPEIMHLKPPGQRKPPIHEQSTSPSNVIDRDVQIVQDSQKRTLTINSQKLQIHNLTLPYLLLKDLCQSAASVDPRTRQKIFKASDIPHDIHPIQCTVSRDSNGLPVSLSITWSHQLKNQPSNHPSSHPPDHTSHFGFDLLQKISRSHPLQLDRHKLSILTPTLWTSGQSKLVDSDVDESDLNYIERLYRQGQLVFNYHDLFTKELHCPDGKGASHHPDPNLQKVVLEKLNEFGLVLFDGLKSKGGHNNHQDQDEFKLKNLIDALGIDIRKTFYGDLWDVISAGDQAKNVANTNLPLDFHMDLVHFENPPRFQFLHCIKNEVTGGISSFVDSYSVAYRLLKEDPEAFRILTDELVAFEYINDNHHTFFKHPTIQLKNGSNQPTLDRLMKDPSQFLNFIQAINYSPPFQSPFFHLLDRDTSHLKFQKVFDSLRKFENYFNSTGRRLNHNPFKFEILLKPGQVVAFDNRRILHARSAFTSSSQPKSEPCNHSSSTKKFNQVDRWLKGAYVDGDSVWDRIRVLNS